MEVQMADMLSKESQSSCIVHLSGETETLCFQSRVLLHIQNVLSSVVGHTKIQIHTSILKLKKSSKRCLYSQQGSDPVNDADHTGFINFIF